MYIYAHTRWCIIIRAEAEKKRIDAQRDKERAEADLFAKTKEDRRREEIRLKTQQAKKVDSV